MVSTILISLLIIFIIAVVTLIAMSLESQRNQN